MASNVTPVSAFKSGLRSPGVKLIVIIVLTAIMAVPLFFIYVVLTERQQRASDAAQDVAQGWGGTQIVGGPALLVPYDVKTTQVVNGQSVEMTQHLAAVFLPSELTIDTAAKSDTRWRGIFPVPVYRASIAMRAKFDHAAITSFVPANATLQWDKAAVWILVSDVRGLAGNVAAQVGGHAIAFEPGNGLDGVDSGSIHAPLHLAAMPDSLSLATNFTLRGSRELSFVPLGRQTTAALRSDWAAPSFFGAFLPSEHRITKAGFDAQWTVPWLARGFGQSFATSYAAAQGLTGNAFGVRFYQPVDFYQLVQRSLKYAILFIGLAFLVFFVAELIAGRRLHSAQYTLIGAAQVLFYLLLLSVAEHTGFAIAYALAASATVILTCLYAGNAFANRAKTAAFFVVLTALYGLLYVILIQEDYALLIGTLVLFTALAITMYATRKLDWSQVAPEIAA